MRIKLLLFLLFFVITSQNLLFAQVNSVVILEASKQIIALKNGVLIIELPPGIEKGIRTKNSGPETKSFSMQDVSAMKDSFLKKYNFSEFYFYQKKSEDDKYIINTSEVEDNNGKLIIINILDNKKVFIAEYINEYQEQTECYYLKNGKPSAKKQKSKNINDYNKESSLYNPEIIIDGGIIIRPYTPIIRPLNKKKSIVSNFVYRRRVHQTLALQERFSECVSELNLKLEKDYTKALKYSSNPVK